MLKGSTQPGVWRSGVWRMEEGLCAGQKPAGVAGGAEKCAAGVLPCSEFVWSLCTSHFWGPWHGAVGCGLKCVQHGRHALLRGRGSLSWVDSRGVTLFPCSSVQLHLSMATLVWAPLQLPSSTAQSDFPRCPFPLC